jgi:MoxR-like ATPases
MEDLSLKDLQKSGYFADQALLDVVNAARFLNKPLLIEGPAGTGKTFLAKTLSGILNLELIRLQCHEGIDEDRAVYEWNYKNNFYLFKLNLIRVSFAESILSKTLLKH